MENLENLSLAEMLLRRKAVVINANDPFTFASGVRSPIYCDFRNILGYPRDRTAVVEAFLRALEHFKFDVLAGTATAGIPWATLIADRLGKPLAYVRSEKKDRGMGKQIEGATVSGKSAIVIEDLISTGGSSFAAVEALRTAGALVLQISAIFTYEFPDVKRKLREGGTCEIIALENFSSLVEVATESGFLDKNKRSIVLEWNKDPTSWGPSHGFPNAERRF